MATQIRSDCNGCETCISCGLKQQYEVHVCDKCRDDGRIYCMDGQELCYDCLSDYIMVNCWGDVCETFRDELMDFVKYIDPEDSPEHFTDYDLWYYRYDICGEFFLKKLLKNSESRYGTMIDYLREQLIAAVERLWEDEPEKNH